MCGITGFFSYNELINTKDFYDSHLKIAHRGPDDEGFLYRNPDSVLEHLVGDDTVDELKEIRSHVSSKPDTSLLLGHRRLSIIDLSSLGHQPLSYDGLHIVYNGEIYNYIELREELVVHGYSFETNCDTEVFLKAYHCWGTGAFNRFNGMWAAGIYNENSNSLLLTRDRFGIKPLYYIINDRTIIFGSEIKFIDGFLSNKKINEELAFAYLRYSYLEHTNETFIKGIFSVEEGSYLEMTEKKIIKQKFYSLTQRKNQDIKSALKKSLKLRMRSDVEVGALLSGGVDSSTLVCLLKEEGHKNLKTFTADFKEELFSEKKYADNVLKQTLFEGHFVNIYPADIGKDIDQLLYTQETPIRSLSTLSQYKIFEYIKKNTDVKVVLSGQGADEIFSGYTNDYFFYLISLMLNGRIATFIKEFSYIRKRLHLSRLALLKKCLVIFFRKWFSGYNKHKLFNKKINISLPKLKHKNYLKNHLYNGVFFSALKEYLRDEDKNSMSFSIESRLPYLDYRLVEEALSLRADGYIKNGESKYTLRKIAKDYIPCSIYNRQDKMGFVSPQEIWQKNQLKNVLDGAFAEIRENGLFEFFDHHQAYLLYQQYQNDLFDDWTVIWRIYCLYQYKKIWNIEG